jgi:hypothetical protein
MSNLPNLQSVSLRFDKKCASDECVYVYAPQTETYRATVLRWLFAGLTDLRRPINAVAIQNYQNLTPISRTVSNWMDEVFQRLEVLRLNVVHGCDFAAPENEIEVRSRFILSVKLFHADIMGRYRKSLCMSSSIVFYRHFG